jgi:hypothetical protein
VTFCPQHASIINVSYQTLKHVGSRHHTLSSSFHSAMLFPPCFSRNAFPAMLFPASPFAPSLMLLTPRLRAIHLLQLLGHPLTENDKLTDLEFLSDVIDVQEDLVSCDVAGLRAHVQRNGAKLQQAHALVSAAFASGRIADAKATVIKMQSVPLLFLFPFFPLFHRASPHSNESAACPAPSLIWT